jgi:hypothetical protein
MMRLTIAAVLGLAAVSCQTYQSDLERSQRAYEKNNDEQALAVLRGLEIDERHLSESERAQYAYLRGMVDYRIGYRADARHWLAIAKEIQKAVPNSIPDEWATRLDEKLYALNEEVYKDGVQALGEAPGGHDNAERAKKADPDAKGTDDDAPKKPKTESDYDR